MEPKRRRRWQRPEVLERDTKYYDAEERYPYQIRICFTDGHTEIYDRRVEQPKPVIFREIEIRGHIQRKAGRK